MITCDMMCRIHKAIHDMTFGTKNSMHMAKGWGSTCCEADVCSPPEEPEEGEPEGPHPGDPNDKLLVCEEVLGDHAVHLVLHKGIPWLCEDLHNISDPS